MNKAYILFLGFSAAVVSVTGAFFSISGLTKLFAGAPMAIMVMAGALELAKMVSASFLHRNWSQMHFIMKFYLSLAVGILMCITSMGIFGYLSYAYQHSSMELKNTMVQIDYLESQERKVKMEVDRLQKNLDEIPTNRVTRRMEAQKEMEPAFQALQKQSIEVQMKLRTENMKKLGYQMEIGPVIYVAELFGGKTDNVATYLILLFVFVFDPLAVCLVLATSFAVKQREGGLPLASPAPSKAA